MTVGTVQMRMKGPFSEHNIDVWQTASVPVKCLIVLNIFSVTQSFESLGLKQKRKDTTPAVFTLNIFSQMMHNMLKCTHDLCQKQLCFFLLKPQDIPA